MQYPDLIELAEISARHRDYRKSVADMMHAKAVDYYYSCKLADNKARKQKLKAAIKLTIVLIVVGIVPLVIL